MTTPTLENTLLAVRFYAGIYAKGGSVDTETVITRALNRAAVDVANGYDDDDVDAMKDGVPFDAECEVCNNE